MNAGDILRLINEYQHLIDMTLMRKSTGLYRPSDLIAIKKYQEEIRRLNAMLANERGHVSGNARN